MSWDTLADLTLKAGINAFKSSAVYTRAADPGNPISIAGVFSAPGTEVDPQTGAAVQSVNPTFGIRLAALPAAPDAGDQIVVKGATYAVLNVDEDGQGGAMLKLGKVS